jgi:hypothetical protein
MMRFWIIAAMCIGVESATTAAPATAQAKEVTVTTKVSFKEPLNTTAKSAVVAANAKAAVANMGVTAPAGCPAGNKKAECQITVVTTITECSSAAALDTGVGCTVTTETTTEYLVSRRSRRLAKNERNLAGETFYKFTMAISVPAAVVAANKAVMDTLSTPAGAAAFATKQSTSMTAAAATAGVEVGSLAPSSTAAVANPVTPVISGSLRAAAAVVVGLATVLAA